MACAEDAYSMVGGSCAPRVGNNLTHSFKWQKDADYIRLRDFFNPVVSIAKSAEYNRLRDFSFRF